MFELFWLRSTGFPFDDLTDLALPEEVTLPVPTAEDEERYLQHQGRARRALADLLARPATAEALLLSNPDALDRLATLGEKVRGPINSRSRQRLRLGWSYLQRFCAKNDTCSFFGPLAWGRVDEAEPAALRVEAGDADHGTLRRRRVFFEHWVVNRLCAALNEDGRLRSALPLRLHPGCDVLGETVRVPLGKEIPVGAETAGLLRAAASPAGLDAGDVAAASPAARRVVSRLASAELRLPPGAEEPMVRIEEAIHSAGTPEALRPVLDAVGELASLRADFEVAGRERRRDLLDRMGRALTAAGVGTERARGEMYVGRFPVYEDCERNLTVTVGEPLARSLRECLTPVMRLYRTVAECAAARLHAWYAEVFAGLPRGADGLVDFPVFLQAVRGPHLERARDSVAGELRDTLRGTWSQLAREGTPDELSLTPEGLRRIAAALTAATPGHRRFGQVLGVGIASPDVLLAARDEEAVRAGEYRLVLGEVHPGVLTALQPVALPFLDEPSAKWARAEANRLLDPGRVLLAASDETYQRSRIDWPVVPNLWEVTLPGSTSRCPRDRQIPAGRGRVDRRDGLLRFVDRASGREEDVVTVLSTDLHRVLFAVAGEVLGGPLTQRVTWRGVELKRRSWSFDAVEVPGATRPAELFADYVAFAAWASDHGMPRHCYFLADNEPKPVYVDWRNPLAVDTFAKTAHQATRIRISEMSPGPDELWLLSGAGGFCSELRMSFVV
ncbi:lantibiotic dehydratase [Streptomyces sp. PRKS01-29]|nr:lantibiotic dehydratase [Streptomyces sabulosicollis]MBI0293379.1 lantibiotic dehydratase [Streptomyces sabulosicollis]